MPQAETEGTRQTVVVYSDKQTFSLLTGKSNFQNTCARDFLFRWMWQRAPSTCQTLPVNQQIRCAGFLPGITAAAAASQITHTDTHLSQWRLVKLFPRCWRALGSRSRNLDRLKILYKNAPSGFVFWIYLPLIHRYIVYFKSLLDKTRTV
jgi:hypothetical protein